MSEKKKNFQVTFIIDEEIDQWVRQARENGCNTSVIFRKILHDYMDAQRKAGGGTYESAPVVIETK
jgi:hypothetical protein